MKKRVAVFFTIFAFLCLLPAAAPAVATQEGSLCDLNGDGVLSASDAAVLLRGCPTGKYTEFSNPDCDFTGNGQIDQNDARAMLLYAAGGIPDPVKFRERVSSGLCGEESFDRFCYAGIVSDQKGNYRSQDVSVSISSGDWENSDYSIADIYIQDISCFVTAFSQGKFRGSTATVQDMFDSVDDGIIAMNGDFYSLHVYGPVIRNGVTYAPNITRNWDIAVLLTNGELRTYEYRVLTKEMLAGMNVYQTWVFGPSLLDEEGHAKTEFHSSLLPSNPRSVLGYYAPGHYAFLTVDGRTKASKGLTMAQLSQLCEELGFVSAYNLDGGRSSILLSRSGPINTPYKDGRPSSDILAIRELPAE